MNILLSQPRSGNTLLRYYIEFLSKRPTLGCLGSNVDVPIYKRKNSLIYIKDKNPILRKTHKVEEAKELLKEKDKLILIIRDFNQILGSHKKRKTIVNKNNFCKKYVQYLEFFVEYKGEKLLVYYEDLLNDVQKALEKVCTFLNIDKLRIHEIVNNQKEFEKDAKGTYISKTISKGIHFYKNRISFEEITNNKIEKYILRYKNNV